MYQQTAAIVEATRRFTRLRSRGESAARKPPDTVYATATRLVAQFALVAFVDRL